jgi:hypothetical protein
LHIVGRQFPEGSVERLVQQCINIKQEAIARAEQVIDGSRSYNITLTDSNGDPIETRLIVVADPTGAIFKEIDDVLYSRDGYPAVIVKQAANGQWWVCMRPTDYNTEDGPKSDPVLAAIKDPAFAFAPKTAGFHEQIVAALVELAKSKGLPEGTWAIWPYNGTAEQGTFGNFTGQEIADALLFASAEKYPAAYERVSSI